MTNIFRSPKLYIGLLAVVIAGKLNFLAGDFAISKFDRVVPPDFLFFITPYWPSTQNLSDFAVLVCVAAILFYVLKKEPETLPYYLIIFAIGFTLRAIFVPLTPLGGYFGTDASYGLTTLQPHGAFPSGHTMFVALAYFLLPQTEKKLRSIALIFILVEIFALIFSRGHYSIDIIGGLLLAYFVANNFIYLKKPFTINKKIQTAN